MKILYKIRASSVGGRSGHAALDDNSLGFDLSPPGSGKSGVNPEQLFAIGYAACFDSALALVAKQMKSAMKRSKTSVEVGLGQTEDGGFVLDIDLYVQVEGVSADEAKKLAEAAHKVCPYSKATRGNIDVRLHPSAI